MRPETTCCLCGSRYRAEDSSVATMTTCPSCRAPSRPDAGAGGDRPSRDAAPSGSPLGEWHIESAGGGTAPPSDFSDDGDGGADRNFSPDAEDDQRRRNLFRIGLCMTLAFFAPIVGLPGRALLFPELSGEMGVFADGQPALVVVVRLLPLLAGLAVMIASRLTAPPLRGALVTGAGAALFALFLADGDVRSTLGDIASAAPSSVSASLLFLLLGTSGMFVGARARWYLPTDRAAAWIGSAGAAFYVSFHLVPSGGTWPLAGLGDAFRLDVLSGIGMVAHFGCLLAAAVVCAINLPSTPSFTAVLRARTCFRLLLASVAVPLLTTLVSVVASPLGQPGVIVPFVTGSAKYAVMFGGLLLLIPVGITDLVVGRTPDA